MSTLSALASDCIANLLEYLTGNEIHLLWSTGDRILRTKLARSISSLKFNFRQGDKFPFAALNLPHLRSLSVEAKEYHFLHLEEAAITASSSLERCNSRITSLRLHFRNVGSLFTRPGSLSLSDRFLSLTDLDMCCYCNDRFINSFSELPKTLTRLKISAHESTYAATQAISILDLFAISNLPRCLLTLEILWNNIWESPGQEDGGSRFEGLFPPHLTSLSLCYLENYTILDNLPSNLEELSLKFQFESEKDTPVSIFSPKLTSLEIYTPLMFDSPLPPKLTRLKVPRTTYQALLTHGNGDPNWKGLPLPPYLQIDPMEVPDLPNDLFRRFKRIQSATIRQPHHLDELCESPIEGFPQRLYIQTRGVKFTKPLPSGIKLLTLIDPMHGDDIQSLPRHLTELDISSLGNSASAELPPPWSLDHVAQLPETLRHLFIPLYVVNDTQNLAPISKLPLVEFVLTDIPSSQLKTAPTWLPYCLPFHLTTLELRRRQFEIELFSPESITLCHLAEVVPHLRSFSTDILFNKDAPMGPLFASLPRNMESLFLRLCAAFELDALSFLPRQLERLFISFIDTRLPDSDRFITNEHFKGLPERLGDFSLHLASKQNLNETLVHYLPKTVHIFRFSSRTLDRIPIERLVYSNIRNNLTASGLLDS